MKRAQKLKALILGICYVLSTVFLSAGLAYADTKPYFKVFGGDVSVGGWFNSGQNSCDPNDSVRYQAPSYNPLANKYKGGILAYAKFTDARQQFGASVDFGAVALGLIEGDSSAANRYGFMSGPDSNYNSLTFANSTEYPASSGFWGGYFEGSRQTHCIPDYFAIKMNSPQTVTSADDFSTWGSGQYFIKPSNVLDVKAGGDIAAGKKITLFVDGNAFISSNITYTARNNYTADNVPKFALVVHGSIYVAPDVSRLDGLYIAQPGAGDGAVDADSGVIWTCHTNNTDKITYDFISLACRNKLTVNGAFIAKQVNLLRIKGDLETAAANEKGSSDNIAEVFNFTLEMVAGGAFFNESGQKYKTESLISLPPVFDASSP